MAATAASSSRARRIVQAVAALWQGIRAGDVVPAGSTPPGRAPLRAAAAWVGGQAHRRHAMALPAALPCLQLDVGG